jgi:hypothetical protein
MSSGVGPLVALVVDPGRAGQAVALRGRLGRPAHHQAGDRQAVVGQSRKSAIARMLNSVVPM